MNRWAILMVGALCLVGMSSAATNLVSTGNFENSVTAWTLYVSPDGTGVGNLSYSDTAAHAGGLGARVHVTETSSENWHIQFKFPVISTIANTIYRLSYYARGPGASVHVGIADNSYHYLSGFTHTYTSEWQKFQGTFVGDGTQRRIAAYLASDTGSYDFDDVTIEAIGSVDPSWYANANARIDSLRKGDFGVQVVQNGAPIQGVPVSLKLLRHEFPFGTALNFQGDENDEWYQQMAAHYFWAGVNESAFKWARYEPAPGVIDSAPVVETLDWAQAQDWTLMRGHALEWGIEKYNYDQHWPRLLSTCVEYQTALKNRIDRDLAQYRGRFQQYDVWNEAFHEPSIFERCGWDLLDSAFVWARAADSTAKLYLNEYSVVAGGETGALVDLVQGLLDRKIPIDGIGVQCHFGSQTIDPAIISQRLTELGHLGLPIMVTEFDLGDMTEGNTLTASEQALQDAQFIRTAFSHPAVQGIMLWGFWDSRHWIPNGGIIEEDKTPKLAADSIWHLWNEEWTTQVSMTSSSEGLIPFRGFRGSYLVTVGTGASAFSDTLTFDATRRVWTLDMNGSSVVPICQRLAPRSASASPEFFRVYDLTGHLIAEGSKAHLGDPAKGLRIVGRPSGVGFVSGRMTRINW